jgi:hypothetical protein
MNLIELTVFAFSAATCLRLIFYRRGSSRFKRHISLIAWLMIVATGSLALCVVTGKVTAAQLHPMGILVLCYLTAATWYAKGNIAQLIRLIRGQQWS